MVANLNDRAEVERFLRNADANELLAEHGHLQNLMASVARPVPEALLMQMVARISYELRFRMPQPI